MIGATDSMIGCQLERSVGAPTVIDLFSGAGLFSLAFKREGFRIAAAYEMDRVAAETHRLNFHAPVSVADLSSYQPTGQCDVIIAGPPCQGFSSIGGRNAADPRNTLCRVIPKWASHCGAQVVVVENVPAFLKTEAWGAMERDFIQMGFKVRAWCLNARDFGVAQNRVRSFTVCSRGILPDLSKLRRSPSFTVRKAWKGLPEYPDAEIQHFAREQSCFAMERIRRIPAGGDVRDLAKCAPELVAPSWYRTGGKIVDIWGRLPWDGIANTLRTGFLNPSRGRFLHPSEDRPISFREAARLQSLPDTFKFAGKPEQISRQIGNGVPLKLGRRVARTIKVLF